MCSTSGGIGPTHDDITADCVAAAFGVSIDVRADARALLEAHYAKSGTELNAARLRMARIPEGAALIDNPVSAAPGFTLENVHVMAGVPAIFEAMVQSVLPSLTGGRAHRGPKACGSNGARARSPGPLRIWPQTMTICPLDPTRSRRMGASGLMSSFGARMRHASPQP